MRRMQIAAALLLAPVVLAAQEKVPPAAQQIALAVQPLPKELRADATVLGYDAAGKLVTIRAGKGPMICLAADPKAPNFHVACYHKSMDPFMKRGRDLRAQGVQGGQVDTVRFKEVKEGKIKMPQSAGLWQMTGPRSSVDVAKGTIGADVMVMYEIYIPFATPASIGFPATPAVGQAWIMLPGTPIAHLMFQPSM